MFSVASFYVAQAQTTRMAGRCGLWPCFGFQQAKSVNHCRRNMLLRFSFCTLEFCARRLTNCPSPMRISAFNAGPY